jgi:hypothetical protein
MRLRDLNPLRFTSGPWTRVLRGLRSGDQPVLLTGLGMLAFQYLRATRTKRTLIYRTTVPIGSTVVVRHTDQGAPRLEINRPAPDEAARTDQTR